MQPATFQILCVFMFSKYTATCMWQPSYLPAWLLSLLQWHQLELGLGISREQHPGWVWYPAFGIRPSDAALWQSRLHGKGWIHVDGMHFHRLYPKLNTCSFFLWCLCRWWTSGHFWTRLKNPTACTQTSSVQLVATGSNVSQRLIMVLGIGVIIWQVNMC